MQEDLKELKEYLHNMRGQCILGNCCADLDVKDMTVLLNLIDDYEKQQSLIESQTRVLEGFIDDTAKLVARNLVAWDTSKDKKEGLLPVVYLKNKIVYQELTGEEYFKHKAIKKFNIL